MTVLFDSKHSLQVMEIVPDNKKNLEGISKIAMKWRGEAEKKNEEASRIEGDKRVSEIFQELSRIANLIMLCMEMPDATRSKGLWNRIFICRDEKIVQAIALVYDSQGYREISHLVTAPWNVRSSVNQSEVKRVEGAAGKIIHHLVATLPDSCERVFVEATNSPRRFYEKLGFKVAVDLRGYFPREAVVMFLDKKKVEKLCSKVA